MCLKIELEANVRSLFYFSFPAREIIQPLPSNVSNEVNRIRSKRVVVRPTGIQQTIELGLTDCT
jgi:hypothetical protein